ANNASVSWKVPELRADVVDPEQGASLQNVTIEWRSTRDGLLCSRLGPIGTICEPAHLSLGTHAITVRAVDPFGEGNSDSITINVINRPPVVAISFPGNGFACRDLGLAFRGSAFDPEGDPVSIEWFDNGSPISTSLNFSTSPFEFAEGNHTI